MDSVSAIIAGSTLITVIAVEYGGVFMLSLLRKRHTLSVVQVRLFRAGHAHAGVLVVLGLLTLVLLDLAGVSAPGYFAAVGVLIGGPILIPAGFFFSPLGAAHRDRPGPLIALTYIGAIVMAVSLLIAGILLIGAGVHGFTA